VLTNTSNLISDTSSAVKTQLTLLCTLPYDIEPDCCVEKITTRPGQLYYVCVLMSAYSLNRHLFQINIIDSANCTCANRGRHCRDCMVVGFQTTYMQSVPITTDVVSLNLDQGEVYNIM